MQPAAEATALRERAGKQRDAVRRIASARREGATRDRDTARAHAARVERARGTPDLDRLRGAANLRLDRAIDLLQEAARAGRADESRDDAALRTQLAPLLIDLLACDALGEGFARVIDAAWFAFREEEARWTPDQLAALAAALGSARADPGMARERGRVIVAELARAGLQVQIAAFDRLAELVHDDEDH